MKRMFWVRCIVWGLGFAGALGVQAQPWYPTDYKADSRKAVDLLSEYVRIPSVSGSGREAEAGRFLGNACKDNGLYVRTFTDQDTIYNFAASIYPLESQKPNIILLTHIDVVPAGELSEWRFPPYQATLYKDTIWGRGTLDIKGMAIMHLMAMLEIQKNAKIQDLPYNITLLAVSGEETGGGNGGKIIASQFLKELTAAVIIGEGGSGLKGVIPSKPAIPLFGISVAEKINLWLKLDMNYITFGHGSTPPPNYANKTMLKALYKLNNIESDLEFNRTSKRMLAGLGKLEGGAAGFVLSHAHWWIFRPLINNLLYKEPLLRSLLSNTSTLTNIYNPPGPPNQISNRVTAFLDCRLLPGTSRKKFIRDVKYGLFEPRFKINIINECPEAEESSPETVFYRNFDKAIRRVYPGAEVLPILCPASSDNNYFREKGVLVYGIMPVLMNKTSMATIHNPNEHIAVSDLMAGKRVFEVFLRAMQGLETNALAEEKNKE